MFQNHIKTKLAGLLLGIAVLLPAAALAAAQVSLQWQPGEESEIAGYQVFMRLEGERYDYGDPAWEGTRTACQLVIPQEEMRYFFVVRAYGPAGSTSPNSEEVCYGCTPCPDDPEKDYAGVCGCGVPDKDIDVDGIWDCIDDDDDNDGVIDAVETGGPNQGDANLDGVPDSQQSHMISTVPSGQTSYLVVESPEGTRTNDFRQVDNPSPEDAPPDIAFDCGIFEFEIGNIETAETIAVTITLPEALFPLTYYGYGVTQGNQSSHWYELGGAGEDRVEIDENILTLYLGDTLAGDNVLEIDNKIVMLGGPAFRDTDGGRHNDSNPDTVLDYPDTPETDGGCFLKSLYGLELITENY